MGEQAFVRFTSRFGPHHAGEVAGFDAAMANRMVGRRVGEIVPHPAQCADTLPLKTRAAPPPVAPAHPPTKPVKL